MLEKKIGFLQEYLSKLSVYVSLSDDAILGNDDKLLAMERSFQLVVDETIDINAVIAYQLKGTVPESYRSTFYEMVPLGIIDQSFADTISESAKVRNQLTHDYEKLSRTDMVVAIKKFFKVYQTYAAILVKKFLNDESR